MPAGDSLFLIGTLYSLGLWRQKPSMSLAKLQVFASHSAQQSFCNAFKSRIFALTFREKQFIKFNGKILILKIKYEIYINKKPRQ